MKYILKYHYCTDPIGIGEGSIWRFFFFFRNSQKNSFTLLYRDKNDTISIQIVYENDIMLQKITTPIFLWKIVRVKSLFGNCFTIYASQMIFFLIHYQMELLSISKNRLLKFIYFDFNHLTVIYTKLNKKGYLD